ncbi:hypothetical protein NX059_010873 [Plenodomus lindquistii]|nr:hypothetical protein NX059_010873 [Plenodomus lindquistii]
MPSNADIARERFSKEAQEWDSNTKHIESTSKALDAIQQTIPAFKQGRNKGALLHLLCTTYASNILEITIQTDLDVLEIGCGTGLLSFMLAPHIRSLIGVDTADGMISAFDTKASALENANLISLNHYLTDADSPQLREAASTLAKRRGDTLEESEPVRFDLIVSHLTLHHIPSLPDLFATLFACAKTGGWVALTDYEDFGPEAVPFHPIAKREGVERHGIKKKDVGALLEKAGFKDVRIEEAFVLRKEVEAEDGKPVREMGFPFLICLGRKE